MSLSIVSRNSWPVRDKARVRIIFVEDLSHCWKISLPEVRHCCRNVVSPDGRGGTQPSVESQASGIPQSWSEKCVSIGTHLRLAAAILDHGRLVAQFHSHHSVGVEERELVFRFRETTHNIVSALVLLEKRGRASRTRLSGYWSLDV
jgi:hypothetical protein